MRPTLAAAGILVLLLVTAGCSRRGESEANQVGGKPVVAVEVSPAARANLPQSIEVVGSLAPKFAADLKSEVTSVVEDVYVTEWVHVSKGQPLAKLDTRESELAVEAAKAALLQAQVAQDRADRELERTTNLKEFGLATQQNLDDARTAKDAAAATTAAAKAALKAAETRLAKAVIRAPMDGVVAFRGVSVGDRVENMGGNAPMFRIVDNRLLDLTVTVPATKSAGLHVGLSLEFTTAALPDRTFRGTVRFINPTVSEADRSVKVVAEVRNEDGTLRGGMFVKGQIKTGERTGVLQIPRAALLSWDLERNTGEIFVINGDVAERRTVRTGEVTGESVEVVQGIAPGEKVVTRGGFNLRPGDRVEIAKPQGV
jgi:membrane fusion protein (multidrug efflux system)